MDPYINYRQTLYSQLNVAICDLFTSPKQIYARPHVLSIGKYCAPCSSSPRCPPDLLCVFISPAVSPDAKERQSKRFSVDGVFNYTSLLLSQEDDMLYVGAREALFALSLSDISKTKLQKNVSMSRDSTLPRAFCLETCRTGLDNSTFARTKVATGVFRLISATVGVIMLLGCKIEWFTER